MTKILRFKFNVIHLIILYLRLFSAVTELMMPTNSRTAVTTAGPMTQTSITPSAPQLEYDLHV